MSFLHKNYKRSSQKKRRTISLINRCPWSKFVTQSSEHYEACRINYASAPHRYDKWLPFVPRWFTGPWTVENRWVNELSAHILQVCEFSRFLFLYFFLFSYSPRFSRLRWYRRRWCLCLAPTGGLFDQNDANKKSLEETVFDLAVEHVSQEQGRRFEAGILCWLRSSDLCNNKVVIINF